MTTHRALVRRIAPPNAVLPPAHPAWLDADVLAIDYFRPESSAHRPRATLQLLHDGASIHGLFRVEDRFVRCVHQNYGDPVYRDSCVEFFVQPRPSGGYFNFEFNCGGAFLCNYITDETGAPASFKAFVRLTAADVASVKVSTSLPRIVEPEIAEPVSWWLAFRIPVNVIERFVGDLGDLSEQTWRGNGYKCGSGTSHPHWAAWAPVDQLNFHRPRCFGELVFE